MSLTILVEIYVPLMAHNVKYLNIDLDNQVNELCKLSDQINIRHGEVTLSTLKIEHVDISNKKIIKLFKNKTLLIKESYHDKILKFTSFYQFVKTGDRDTDLLSPFWSFAYFTEKTVQHLLVCLNIVRPAVFDTRDGVLVKTRVLNGEPEVTTDIFPMMCSSIDIALQIGEKYQWPKVSYLPVNIAKEVLHDNWPAFENISKNRLQRALNAFSYFFHDNLLDNSHIDLFYSLIGLEALYVSGKENIQKQVDLKSQLLLGPRTVFKKKFSELYDFRSRYIHGDLNFTNKFCVGDHIDDAYVHKENSFDHSSLGILILLSSIQKHLELKKSEIEFEFRIKDS